MPLGYWAGAHYGVFSPSVGIHQVPADPNDFRACAAPWTGRA
jgi:hypothetical protein